MKSKDVKNYLRKYSNVLVPLAGSCLSLLVGQLVRPRIVVVKSRALSEEAIRKHPAEPESHKLKRSGTRAIGKVVKLGVFAAAVAGAYRYVIRPWQSRWKADNERVRSQIPNGEVVEEMIVVSTRGITIDPAQQVDESTVNQGTLQK